MDTDRDEIRGSQPPPVLSPLRDGVDTSATSCYSSVRWVRSLCLSFVLPFCLTPRFRPGHSVRLVVGLSVLLRAGRSSLRLLVDDGLRNLPVRTSTGRKSPRGGLWDHRRMELLRFGRPPRHFSLSHYNMSTFYLFDRDWWCRGPVSFAPEKGPLAVG